MSSLDEANHFVNCVMNRYRNDTIMRVNVTLLLIAVPFMAVGLGFAILNYKQGDLKINDYLASVAMMLIWFLLLILMFLTYRRLEDHSNRDRVWRDILIHYAKERGCNTVELERCDRFCHSRESSSIIYPAMIIMAIYFLLFVLTVCYPKVVYYEWGIHLSLELLIMLGAAFNFIMFLMVFRYAMKYPYLHESAQIQFVDELRRVLSWDKLIIPEMLPAVKHTWLIIHIFLFMITGGLYAILLIISTYRSTNDHLFNQWSYEIKLMDAIIKHEGGKGIVLAPDKKTRKRMMKEARRA